MIRRYDIITFGSGLVDAFVSSEFKENNGRISFPLGTKILVKNIGFSTGGGGVNSAVCFSHLGLKTGFLGRIGSGYNGQIVLRELKKNNIDFLGLQSKEHTGYSIILEGDKKHRTILTFKGASENLNFSEINLKKLHTKWFYFTSLGGESFESQKKIAKFAKKKGIKLAYNPSSYHTKRGINYLKNILKNTYVLSLNKEEAGMLIKQGNLCEGLYNLGPRIVCVTDGENEGEVYDGRFLYRYLPHKVNVRESTGAGDIFGSSFVFGLIKLQDIGMAIRVAMINAENAIATLREKNRLLDWDELKRIIKIKKFKIKKEMLI